MLPCESDTNTLVLPLQQDKLLIFKLGTKTVLLCVDNIKPLPPKITEFWELIIWLPLEAAIKLLQELVFNVLSLPPIID